LLDYDNEAYAETVACVCRDLAQAHPRIDAALLVPRYLETNWAVWAHEELSPVDRADGFDVWRDTWVRTLASLGHNDADIANLAWQLYLDYRHRDYKLYGDALTTLEALRPHYKLAVITNGPVTTQRDKLRHLKLETLFNVVTISGEAGVKKPDGAIFEQTLRALGVSADEALYVGDSLPVDVAGALDVGMTAVWLNRKGAPRKEGDPEANQEIASLEELAGLLHEVSKDSRTTSRQS